MMPLSALLLVAVTPAAELAIYPSDVPLVGRQATQQLIVVTTANGRATADRTATVKFISSHPAVATVDAAGLVTAVGDGQATITATGDGQSASAVVQVRGTKADVAWGFRNHVQAVFTRTGCNSGACHGALAGKGGLKLSLRGYDSDADHFALTRQALARRVDRDRPAESLLLRKATRAMPHGGGKRFEDDALEYRVLHDWIASGAAAPSDADPRLERLEVFPPAAVLKPKDGLQVLVRAWYSDGHAEDVTRWAKFSSSEDPVATVTEDGQVTVVSPGEAAVNVVFGTAVAAVPVSVPFPTLVADAAFTASPVNNFIDELVLNKLKALRIPPSPQADDRTFIRRAYLDAAGLLPTPDEVARFLADPASDKRSKLVDALLNRPEFTDYWTYKWSDLLLVSTRKLPATAMWAFHKAVRQAVADDVPWDRFARSLLTANGSTLHNGLGNYFVLHKDTAELTEATAVTFLGMSITCARCHNHPLEKWTQDQYWSLANLFSRVSMKNGDRPGEVLVQEQPFGDVPHPRRGVPVPPAPLDAKPLPDGPASRRAAFADWLTRPDNPYFAKAVVNRVWRNFLGRGLVEAEDDLRATNPPSNPELFDALAADFIKGGHDVKRLIRLIMNSAAYQRSAATVAGNEADDRFYSRFLVRRLTAEVILDAYSQVTGVPTPFDRVYTGVEGGTAATQNFPLGTRALQLPDSRVASRFLDAFGRPDREQTCSCERQQDSSVGQALHLNNGQTLNDKLRSKGSIVERWLTEKTANRDVVRQLFAVALSREPTPTEETKLIGLLVEAGIDRREAIEDLCWAVLTGREFLFNH